jgi:predicted transcriptional regulator YdeE
MEAQIEQTPALSLLGLSFFGDPFSASAGWTEENEIGRLWGRYMRFSSEHAGELPPPLIPDVLFEAHVPHEQTEETGHYEVFVGYAIDLAGAEAPRVPAPALIKLLRATRTACFTVSGVEITDESKYAEMDEWIATQNLRRSASWIYNRYNSRYKGIDRLAESTLVMCIPVE